MSVGVLIMQGYILHMHVHVHADSGCVYTLLKEMRHWRGRRGGHHTIPDFQGVAFLSVSCLNM